MSNNKVTSVLWIILYLAVLARIMLGPFPYAGVVAFHYLERVGMVSFLTMLSFSRVVKTLFILDFQRMSAVPEKGVMTCMGVVTFFCTSAHVVQEALVRRSRGLDHFGRMYFFSYLGQVVSYLLLEFLGPQFKLFMF